MARETKSNSKSKSNEAPDSKLKPEAKKAPYEKWTTILSTVIAAGALVVTIGFGITNHNLNKSNYALNQEKNNIQNQLDELNLQKGKRDVSVDLETRYYVVTGSTIMDIKAKDVGNPEKRPAIVKNKVLEQLEQWQKGWEIQEEEDGSKLVHGVVILRISNRGKESAHKITLNMHQKDFAIKGEEAEVLWELEPTGWAEDTISLSDLSPGQSVSVPLAHILGTTNYFGRVLLPAKLQWLNPTTQKNESMTVGGMVPEEQWQVNGTNISVAQ